MTLTEPRQLEEVEGRDIDIEIEVDEEDVEEIAQSIKEAQYFDASSMAPLTPTSVVSNPDSVEEARY